MGERNNSDYWVSFVIVVWLLLAFVLFLGFLGRLAYAHEHQTGETDEQRRVIEFYRTWHRPQGDFSTPHRQGSCCYAEGGSQDCFPVLATRRRKDGVLEVMPDTEGTATQAQLNYGGRWYPLSHGIEEDKQPDPRESPDGRSHVCVTGTTALCYVGGWGN